MLLSVDPSKGRSGDVCHLEEANESPAEIAGCVHPLSNFEVNCARSRAPKLSDHRPRIRRGPAGVERRMPYRRAGRTLRAQPTLGGARWLSLGDGCSGRLGIEVRSSTE